MMGITMDSGDVRQILTRGLMAVAVAWTLGQDIAQANPGVLFDRSVYQVAPGEVFDVQLLLDGEVSTQELEAIAHGLFSYGWQVEFAAVKAQVNSLVVPSELDFFGFDAGASLTTGPGLAGAEGNIDQAAFTPYTGNLLGTITLQNLALVPDEYDLTLSLAPHFPTEQLFLDGEGNVLDDKLVLGSARVVVAPVPEPSAAWLAVSGFVVLAGARRAARKRTSCERLS